YMQKVVYLVGSKVNSWAIEATLPKQPERIQWDAEYDMPRVMFLAERDSDDGKSLWSMNINGTDIKLMISNEEIINLRMRELNVSPNGRYLFANSAYEGFYFKCYLYDLKEQTATFISEDQCSRVKWIDDEHNAVMVNGFGPVRFTMKDKKLHRTKELLHGEDDYGIKSARGMQLSMDKTKLVRATNRNSNYFYHDGDDYGPGDFIVYDVNTFEYIDKLDYFPKGCDSFMYNSVDKQHFTCNKIYTPYTKTSRGYHVFNIKPPFKKVGEAIGVKVVQLNVLNSNLRSFLYRERKANENSPINRVRYSYRYNNHRKASTTDFYISPNLVENYSERDFTRFFPPLPSVSEVAEAKRRIKEQQNGSR
ncbi:MAG: hypothetical protein HRU26_04380, partial [Psychroserpens sp.]|nr:hypothetical protein [Psychroserpens sp.]